MEESLSSSGNPVIFLFAGARRFRSLSHPSAIDIQMRPSGVDPAPPGTLSMPSPSSCRSPSQTTETKHSYDRHDVKGAIL